VAVVIGLALRAVGVPHGLPFLYDPDEPDFVVRAYTMLAQRDANPHWFGHPGTVTMYVLAALYGVYAAGGLAVGHFKTLADVGAEFWRDPAIFYFIGRTSILVFAGLSMCATWLLARRVANARAAFLAVVLLALAPIHVEISQLVRSDVQQGFFMLCAVWFALSIAETGRLRDYVLAGLCVGLGVATKYPAVLAAVSVLAAWAADVHKQPAAWVQRTGRLFAAGAASLAGAFIGSPFLFLDLPQVLDDLRTEARTEHLSATNEGLLSAIRFYLDGPLADALTPVGLVLVLLGMLVLWRRLKWDSLPIVVLPPIYLLFIASLSLMWARWTVALLPFLCVLAATGADGLVSRLFRNWGRVAAALAFLVIATALAALPAQRAWNQARETLGGDTRTAAMNWAMRNIPAGAKVLQERYTPQFPRGHFDLLYVSTSGEIVPSSGSSRFVVPSGYLARLKDIKPLDQSGVEYLILGSDMDRRVKEGKRYASELAIYAQVLESAELVYEVLPLAGERRGNPVRIYRIREG